MQRTITVFGGSGFIGRHLVQRLAQRGDTIRVATRDTEAALYLKPLGSVGQVVPVYADITRPETVSAALEGADGAVNLVGILFEKGKRTFANIHAEGAATVARIAAEKGVRTLVQLSALGADEGSPSAYARTKALGEAAVKSAFPDATILRPGVVFGPEDDFFNLFAGLSMFSPALPVIGCPLIPDVSFADGKITIDFYGRGGAWFQPVYVGDVADAIVQSLEDADAREQTFELAGPRVFSFKELMEQMMAANGRKCALMPVAYIAAEALAWFLEFMPRPLLTRDQVEQMKLDNVASGEFPGLADLGIAPTSLQVVLPTYLGRFRPPARQDVRAS